MRKLRSIRTWAFALAAVLTLGGPARAETDEGVAGAYPWSGWWWQHQSGGLTGPLGKYDQVTGAQAARWEYDNHVATATEQWFGHCHAWSASSVLEREPRTVRQVGPVGFGVGDQKGLLAACHDADIANSYGDRYGDGVGSEDPNDIAPDELWRVLNLFLQRQKLPLILDFEPGPQIWNFPVYQYQVTYHAIGNDWYDATMDLYAADDNVSPDYIGTQYTVHRYTFRVRIQDGALVLGSGQWTGYSVADHPDFAWYPYVAVAENPSVDANQVSNIVSYTVGAGQPAPSADNGPVRVDTNPDHNPPPPSPNPPNPNPTPNPPTPNPTPNPPTLNPPVQFEGILTPYELVDLVLNRTSSFDLDIFVDRGDGGKYRPGEPVRVSARSGEAGYLYLFDVDRKQGTIALVFPTTGEPNYLKSDTLYDLPVPGVPLLLVARGSGQHDVKAIMLDHPIQITGTRQAPAVQQDQTTKRPPPPPQKIVVPPTTEKQMKSLLQAGFQKGKGGEGPPAPGKLGRFAQDVCAYFVLEGTGKPNQSGKPSQ